MRSTKNKKGFTLIELVIVLAIAALILAAIFLAVSGAQRSQRDSARRSDAGRILSLAETMAGNNGGVLPSLIALQGQVTAQNMVDPGGTPYTLAAGPPAAAGAVQYVTTATCAGVGTPRQLQVTIFQEVGGNACYDNH